MSLATFLLREVFLSSSSLYVMSKVWKLLSMRAIYVPQGVGLYGIYHFWKIPLSTDIPITYVHMSATVSSPSDRALSAENDVTRNCTLLFVHRHSWQYTNTYSSHRLFMKYSNVLCCGLFQDKPGNVILHIQNLHGQTVLTL